MKLINEIKIFILSIIFVAGINAQNITFTPLNVSLEDTLGSEIVFDIELKNISTQEQTIFIVRSLNDLPADWVSSLCFDFCFPSDVDSVVTNPTFGSSPLQPDEVRNVALHVFPMTNLGTGNIKLEAGTTRDPSNRIIVDLSATAIQTTSAEDETLEQISFDLMQNYPNPFNNGTLINYQIEKEGQVELTLYDILGNKIMVLDKGNKSAGTHTYHLNAEKLSSGVYFYRLKNASNIQTKKMILEK